MAPTTIQRIEPQLWNFYSPTFRIEVSGDDVLTKHHMEVVSVQVDNALNKADQFTFVVNNGFDVAKREFSKLIEFFEFGAPVSIYMGYVERSKSELMVDGIITSVSTSFPAQGLPQITVSGYDRSFCLMKNVGSKNWDKTKDSTVVSEIARAHGLNPKVEDTETEHPKVEKNQESDFQFVEKLARRNGFEFYVKGKDLFFIKPANDETGVLELEWGAGLMSFTPEVNLAEQVSAVEVRGWDPKSKREYVGIASAGGEPGRDPGRKSGGEYARRICKEVKVKVRRSVSSQREAEKWAAAILKARAEGFVRGSGESIGLPILRAGRNVKLGGIGKTFSREYFLEQCTHTISTGGYKTTFRVKDVTI